MRTKAEILKDIKESEQVVLNLEDEVNKLQSKLWEEEMKLTDLGEELTLTTE